MKLRYSDQVHVGAKERDVTKPPISVVHIAAERRLIRRLRDAGATSPLRAYALGDLRWVQRRRLRRLLRVGAIREAHPGAYFLDESVYAEHRRVRWVRALVGVAVMLVILIAVLLVGRAH